MNTGAIKNYLKLKSLDENSLIINYDFLNFSGNFIKNNVFDFATQFSGDNATSYLNGIYNPGLFNKLDSNIISGSGLFNRNNFLTTSNPTRLTNFTCIIKYKNFAEDFASRDGVGEIIFAIQDANSLNYELFLGLDDLKKIFLDFSGSNFYSLGLDNLFAQNNIVSLNYNYSSNDLVVSHFNLFDKTISENILKINDENLRSGNKILFFGGIGAPIYTGFHGYINNILIFDSNLSKDDIFNISLLIEKTGTTIQQEFINLTGLYKESGYINPTGVIGIGLVDYNIIQNNLFVENINDNINTFVNLYSGITGYITGEVIEYKKIENNQKILIKEYETDLYDNFSINLYSGASHQPQNIFNTNDKLLFDNNFQRFI